MANRFQQTPADVPDEDCEATEIDKLRRLATLLIEGVIDVCDNPKLGHTNIFNKAVKLREHLASTPDVAQKPKPSTPKSKEGILDALKMDGRKRMPRVSVFKFPSTPMNVATIRGAIARFEERGCSDHSSRGGLLRYIMAYCEAKNIPYRLTRSVADGKPIGYHIERVGETKLDA